MFCFFTYLDKETVSDISSRELHYIIVFEALLKQTAKSINNIYKQIIGLNSERNVLLVRLNQWR